VRSGRRAFPTFGQGMLVVLLVMVFNSAAGFGLAIVTIALKEEHQRIATLFGVLLGACVSAALVLNWASGERREPLRLLVVPKLVAPVPLVFALVATLGADVVLLQVNNCVRWLIQPWPIFREIMSSFGRANLPLVIAVVVLVGPVSEELIFRGVLLRGFLENYGRWTAILVSSFLFAFIHLNPWQAVSGFFLGCLFAWFVARTGSLFPAIMGHMVSNLLGLATRRLDARIPGITTEGFHPWWLTALGALVTAAGIVAFHHATRAARNAGADSEAEANASCPRVVLGPR
jgi:membrane protease YdiL (CAAX protease family)